MPPPTTLEHSRHHKHGNHACKKQRVHLIHEQNGNKNNNDSNDWLGTHWALTTRNLIRETISEILQETGQLKPMIDLTLGDPTRGGDPFCVPRAFRNAVIEAVGSGLHDGYSPAVGFEETRAVIAASAKSGAGINDVVITAGCTAALDITIRSIAGPGDIVAVPSPAFPMYESLLHTHGIDAVRYILDPLQNFNVDFQSLRSLQHLGSRIKAVVVNNPSNPAGSVFSRPHLVEFVQLVRELFPSAAIVADEIYDQVVFDPTKQFHALAPIATSLGVACITVSGVSKNWMCPGWRIGWLIAHDRRCDGDDSIACRPLLNDFRKAARALSTVTMGATSFLQAALASVLAPKTPAHIEELRQFRVTTNNALRRNADILVKALREIPGVTPHEPSGAMYVFATLDLAKFGGRRFTTTRELCKEFLCQQGVLMLPGECFRTDLPCVRFSIAVPQSALIDGAKKFQSFQARCST